MNTGIVKFILAEEELIGKILIDTNGDIFESAIKMYDYMVEELLKDKNEEYLRRLSIELANTINNLGETFDLISG